MSQPLRSSHLKMERKLKSPLLGSGSGAIDAEDVGSAKGRGEKTCVSMGMGIKTSFSLGTPPDTNASTRNDEGNHTSSTL